MNWELMWSPPLVFKSTKVSALCPLIYTWTLLLSRGSIAGWGFGFPMVENFGSGCNCVDTDCATVRIGFPYWRWRQSLKLWPSLWYQRHRFSLINSHLLLFVDCRPGLLLGLKPVCCRRLGSLFRGGVVGWWTGCETCFDPCRVVIVLRCFLWAAS